MTAKQRNYLKLADFHLQEFHLITLYQNSCKVWDIMYKDFRKLAHEHYDAYLYYAQKAH